jgi:hypothetical protein
MVTASGTYATGYDVAQLSGVISKDGGAWASLGSRFSGIPGGGVYNLVALSSTEMTCWNWIVKVTANSGCLEQCIMGQAMSGIAATDCSAITGVLANTSNIFAQCSSILTNVSGVKAQCSSIQAQASSIFLSCSGMSYKSDVSGLAGVLANTSNIFAQCSSILTNVSGVKAQCSSIQAQCSSIYPTLANTSNLIAQCSSLYPILANTSNIFAQCSAILTNVSGVKAQGSSIQAQCSSILQAVSSVSATVNYSGIAEQVWNSLTAAYTSAPTFGGAVLLSGKTGSTPVILAGVTHANALVGLWGSTHTSAQIPVVTEVRNAQSGNAGTATVDISSIANMVWAWTAAVTSSRWITGGVINSAPPASATVDVSSIASQVWNSLIATYTSTPTFGGSVMLSGELSTVSGLGNILAAVSGLNTSNLIAQCSSIIGAVSSPSTLVVGQTTYASGLFNMLGAISGIISGVAGIATTDGLTIASGTLAEDLRRLRWFAWENLNIDKRYSPVRLYLKTDATNYSSYFNLADDANNTTRTRGG